MANDESANDCSFQWYIYNPFLSVRDLEATFYQGSPTITQWKVTLRSLAKKDFEIRKYSVTLVFDVRNNGRCEIATKRILLSIKLDDKLVFNKEVPNYHFNYRNRCRCCFGIIVLSYHKTVPNHLEMNLDISLPLTARENEEALVSNDRCLQMLSRDLRKLLWDEENLYPNMNLLFSNDLEPIQAHSYMLYARWNNFFREHDTQYIVETNISKDVLSDILEYMYTGEFPIGLQVWQNPDYISELFHVMNRYGLYHLHKVFVKSDLEQLLVTENPAILQSYHYPLNFVNGRRINENTHTWKVGNSPEHTFKFIVRNENWAGPWISYTLHTTSSSEVRANVRLAVIKQRHEEDPPEEVLPFHEKDYTMGPNDTVMSRYVLFLGCPETFGYTEGTEIRFCIRCLLSVTDGTTIGQIRNRDDETLLNESVRFGVLSDHMRQLQHESFDADVVIRSRNAGIEQPHMDLIHKGIFASRCPYYLDGLEYRPLIQDPMLAVCRLSPEALRFVLDYMYTGRVFEFVPRTREGEIRRFANRSRFLSLRALFGSPPMVREGYGRYVEVCHNAPDDGAVGDDGARDGDDDFIRYLRETVRDIFR